MEILNVGPLEFIIILALMFIILGPKDMIKTAQSIGRWVRSVTHSPMWREVWGISQDIRELPKKLMEDTGLEEALADVQKTTQEVADEFNTQIKEAQEAARVPELEHVRIDPNQPIAPPAGSVPAALPATVDTALAAVDQPAAEELPAVVAVAEGAPTARKPRRKKLAEEQPADGLAAAEPEKRTRRKKQPAAEDQPAAIDLPAEEIALPAPEQAAEAAPAKPRKPRVKKVSPAETAAVIEQALPETQPGEQPEAIKQPEAEEPFVVETPVKARKPRRKKVVEESAVLEEQLAAENQPAAAALAEAEAAAPVKARKPRRKKTELDTAVAAGPEAIEQPEADNQPAVVETVSLVAAGDASVELPKARKPRRKKVETAEQLPPAPVEELPAPVVLAEDTLAAAVELPEAAEQPAAIEQPAANDLPAAQETADASARPAAEKKPRRRKLAESVPPEALPGVPAAPTRRPRARKAAEPTPVVITYAQVETPPSNGQSNAEVVDAPAPQPQPRKRRAAGSPGAEPPNGNGIKPARTRKKRLAEQEPTALAEQASQSSPEHAEPEPVERSGGDAS